LSFDREKLRALIEADRYEWSRHALRRIDQRDLYHKEVIQLLREGDIIEDYPDDKPFPSALFMGHVKDGPLHVVAALDDEGDWLYIVTAYRPDLRRFEPDYRTRREG